MPKSLARLISEARVRAGLSQHALAREVGLAASHIARLETGAKQMPRFDTIARLAIILGLSLDEIARDLGYDIVPKSTPLNRADARMIASRLGDLRQALKAADTAVGSGLELLAGAGSPKRRR